MIVNRLWRSNTGEDYFGSRDIDLGFHTPPKATLESLKGGSLPATVRFLESNGFTREGMYSLVRYYAWETDRPLTPTEVRDLASFDYYCITVDLITSHKRADLRKIANFQPFTEPLLSPVFEKRDQRRILRLDGRVVWVPAPHVLIGMKLVSLPQRTKDDKALKDLCDLYALVAFSGVPPASLGSSAGKLIPNFPVLVRGARDSPFLRDAATHLGIAEEVLVAGLDALL